MPRYYGDRGYTNGTIKGLHNALKRLKKGDFCLTLVTYVHGCEIPEAKDGTYFHGFILHDFNSDSLYVVMDGVASGYGGEGPRGLADCMRMLPPGTHTQMIRLSHSKANELFNMELTNSEIHDLFKLASPLKITWGYDGGPPTFMGWRHLKIKGLKADHPYYDFFYKRRGRCY